MGRTKKLIENNHEHDFYLYTEKVFIDQEYWYYEKKNKEKSTHEIHILPHRAVEEQDSTDRDRLHKWINNGEGQK
jgi:hypothetical protein